MPEQVNPFASPFDEIPIGHPIGFRVERGTAEEGATFSSEAMVDLVAQIQTFVLTQVRRRWNETNEPPTVLTVTVKCEVR